MRDAGPGAIYSRPYSSNASIYGGTSGKARPIYAFSRRGIRYWEYVYRIVAMYAIGELFNQGPLADLREVHHLDDDVNNWKPSNLVIAKDRWQHKDLDRLTRAGLFIKLDGAVYVGDIIRDNDFPVEIALSWWRGLYEDNQD